MGIVERYRLYIQDLTAGLIHQADESYSVSINQDEEPDIVMYATNEKESVMLFSYNASDFELSNDIDEDPDKWFNQLQNGTMAQHIEYGTNERFQAIQKTISPYFQRYCKAHAAEFVLKTSEFELVSIVEQSDEGNIRLAGYSRKGVYSICISKDISYYIAEINGLDGKYYVKHKDDSSN